ncbi:Bug family tripartite tricarboxylate transporter substrate binding protein [Mesorhizobium sp. A623]
MNISKMSRRSLMIAGAVGATMLMGAPLHAETYPSKPITFIVPGSPGGGMDVVTRVVAEYMSKELGQPIVVENKPGAAGSIGAEYVAHSQPDGYTIFMGQTSHFAINPGLYSSLPYDPIESFIPISLLADAPNVVVVPKDSPLKNMTDLIEAARNADGALSLAVASNGTVSHLTGELLETTAGVTFNQIPYKGAAPAIVDVVGGRIDFMLSSIPTALGQIRAGGLRPIAVSADKRSPTLPDIPTIAEQGYPGFNAGTWYGLFAPAGTDSAIIDRLFEAAQKAITDDAVRAKLQNEGGDTLIATRDELRAKIKADLEKWGEVIKISGATVN